MYARQGTSTRNIRNSKDSITTKVYLKTNKKCLIDQNVYLAKENVQMSENYIKKYSAQLIFREAWSKTLRCIAVLKGY